MWRGTLKAVPLMGAAVVFVVGLQQGVEHYFDWRISKYWYLALYTVLFGIIKKRYPIPRRPSK